ncbi:HAD domain-containing protein [Streptomyces cellostaticus]|uniref:HAD domain-containing protein n=1 Tax=Streptomyces cellostaticus TaxID=67285 RepID=UPI0020262723|nr:HAD domain-containing protein [Streptomyces cellostaticus]
MLLFLDVDGPLIPFGADRAYPVYDRGPAGPPAAGGHPLLHRVDPALGARLDGLGCELVWATTWMDDANACLAPWLGLPALPVVRWPDEDEPPGLPHWKTRPLVDWAAGRSFVWLDDELTEADRAWVAVHHPAPALLHRVDHRYGLTDADFTTVTEWLRLSAAPLSRPRRR